jgi:hypothetical protein
MIRLRLDPALFDCCPRTLLTAPGLVVETFRFASGVEALRLAGTRTRLVVLPFRGQQIWRAEVDGRDLTMRSIVPEPVASASFLESFGAFFVHCGLTAMGAPGPGDSHPLHGECPAAPMDEAWLEVEEGPEGSVVRLTGRRDYAQVFKAAYRAEPAITFKSGDTVFEVAMTVTNRLASPMPFMYLGHANFRPVDGGRLAYSARYDAASVRLRGDIPSHITPSPDYARQLADLARDPTGHHRFATGQAYDPEVVFFIDYLAGQDGFAHSLQIHPDGSGDWIAHRPEQCPMAMRWLSRTPDQDCLALAEPATSGVGGFAAEQAAGRVPILAPGASWTAHMRMGHLDPEACRRMEQTIDRIAGRR